MESMSDDPGAVHELRLDEQLVDDLRALAARSGRDIDELAIAALREYVRYTRELMASVEDGLRDADTGRVHDIAEVRAYLAHRREARTKG